MAQSEVILKKILEDIATKENLENHEIKIVPLTTEGANYTSAIFKAVITSQNKPPYKLFAKVAILAESVRPQMAADRLFEIERIVYFDLANVYEEIQVNNGIPEDERFKFPKIYGCNSNYMEETVVLEDLVAQGYTMFDRFKTINWEYASKVVEELAKLHALSFAYKQHYPDEFAKNYSKFALTELPGMDEFTAMSENMTATACDALSDVKYKERLKMFTKDQLSPDVFLKYYGPGKREVITHGDYRNSNIMFKRQGGKVKRVVPVDYQTMRLGTPVNDVLYFVYSGTDGEFRRRHLKNLLDHYYRTFATFLRRLNVDPDQSYSRADFDQDYKDHLPHGLNTALFLLPIILVDAKNAPDTSAEGSGLQNFVVKPNDSYNRRFSDIFYEFAKLGVL